MMERQLVHVITETLEAEFRNSIEGCIPDLMEAASQGDMLYSREPDEDFRDNVYDYAADRSYDTFPNVPHEDRTAMAKRIATYFCGGA